MTCMRAIVLIAATAAVSGTPVHAADDWRSDHPGKTHRVEIRELPGAGATRWASNGPTIVTRPAGVKPVVPAGFEIALFADGLSGPRLMRTAPNGDIFVAESRAGRITVLRPSPEGALPVQKSTFAEGLSLPFGLAFFPSRGAPRHVYVGTPGAVIRFDYRDGDLAVRGRPQKIIDLPETGGHSTRDILFMPDDRTMLVSVGSAGNAGEGMGKRPLKETQKSVPPGAAWGDEEGRAAVVAFDPEGSGRRLFATGLRNCVSIALEPVHKAPWCAVNERDGVGDDLVPDYITRVKEGHFYGWPWFWLGAHPDPRLAGKRPDLADKVTVPDLLIQAHSAPLQMLFYEADAFPASFHGDAFVALHGSWNRSKRTGYKVVRARMTNGGPTGDYEDFVTGFVLDDKRVWGRPVGLTVMRDGSLLISDDAGGTIWRVTANPQSGNR